MRRRPSADQAQTKCRSTRDHAASASVVETYSSTGSLVGGIEKNGPSRDPRQSFSRVKAGPVRLAYRKKQPQGALSADQAQTKRRPGAEEAQRRRRPSADQAQINQRKCSQCFNDRNKQWHRAAYSEGIISKRPESTDPWQSLSNCKTGPERLT